VLNAAFDRVVVREVIDNPQRFIDLSIQEPDSFEKIFGKSESSQQSQKPLVLDQDFGNSNAKVASDPTSGIDRKTGNLSDLSIANLKALMSAPPNSIVGTVVTPGYSQDQTPKIYYPFFPPHLSFPIKPGETVWVMDPAGNSRIGPTFQPAISAPDSFVTGETMNNGYWMSRIPAASYVEDVNHTHLDRQRSVYYKDSQRANESLDDFPPDFSNGPYTDGRSPTIANKSFDFNNIRFKALSNENVTKEPVPRFTKRPGDLVIQGSNNTLISLGEDRPKADNGSNSSYKNKEKSGPRLNSKEGTIDIVAGRGFSPEGSQNNANVVKNILGQDETEKRSWAQDASRKKLVKITEGDPDLIYDLSRVYVSMKTDGDKNFGYEKKESLPNPGSSLEPVDSKPYVILKSNEIRIIARQAKDGQEIKENGSLRIIKEGARDEAGHSIDQSVISMQPDGTLMIDGPTVIIGSGKEKSNGQGDQVLLGGSTASQPIVLGNELKSLIQELILAIKSITVPTGTGPSGPPINIAQFEAVSNKLDLMLSKVGKTK
tara:strand:+ start:45583 stop:47214 length:1632 start_codon:yes stop_codon:yes gene_type:complete